MSDALDHGLQRREASLIAPIDLDKAVFLSLWMEAILYGVFLVLFVGTIYALVYKRSTERVNRPMLYTACTILLLATAHLCLDLVRCLQAFIDAPRAGSSALAYFANIAHPTHMAKTSVLVTETYVADGLLVYRLYVVWMRNVWIAIIPCLLVISTAISGYAATYMLGQLAGTGASVFAVELRQWITSFFTITLSNNVLCTLLIAYRIWSTHKGFEAGGSLNSVIQVVVESGAIYSAALIIQIIVYLLGSNAQYAVLDPLSPLIGIVFSLIIIRVAMGLSHGGSGHGRHTSGTQQRSLSVFQAQSQPHSVHPMKPLAVQVTQGVHSHSDPATVADISHSMSTNKTLGGGYSDDDLEFTSVMPKGRAY